MVILDLFSLELAHLPMLHATHFRGKPMSQFKEKVFAACAKKKLSLTKVWGAMPCALCSLELILLCQLL